MPVDSHSYADHPHIHSEALAWGQTAAAAALAYAVGGQSMDQGKRPWVAAVGPELALMQSNPSGPRWIDSLPLYRKHSI